MYTSNKKMVYGRAGRNIDGRGAGGRIRQVQLKAVVMEISGKVRHMLGVSQETQWELSSGSLDVGR